MKQIAQGSQIAFRELFHRHGALVLGYGLRLMKNRANAEDISQDVWIRVVRAAPQFEDRGTFKAWVLKIVRHCSLNLLREQSRLQMVESSDDASPPMTKDEFDAQVLQRAEAQRVRELIEALPDQQRAALVIWLTEDVSYEELAETMGTTVTAVKSLLFRARRQLEVYLREDGA